MADIKAFGVAGDGTLEETHKIQSAIEECAEKNEVLEFTEGIYLSFPLELKDNSNIHIGENALLKACENWQGWERTDKMPFIRGEGKSNIKIAGKGIIDCSREAFHDCEGAPVSRLRPDKTIALYDCTDVTLKDFTIKDSVCENIYLKNCKDVKTENIIIRNPEWWKSHNSDGIAVSGGENIEISACDIETGNDGISMKTAENETLKGVKISDCLIRTSRTALKIGTALYGDVCDVDIKNIKIEDHREKNIVRHPEQGGHVWSAVSLITSRGGNISNITADNVVADFANTPILMVAEQKFGVTENIGKISNVSINDFHVKHAIRAAQINIADGCVAENIKITNSTIVNYENHDGEFKCETACGRWYPAGYTFGHMPAYGLYGNNVKNVELSGSVFKEDVYSKRPSTILKGGDAL